MARPKITDRSALVAGALILALGAFVTWRSTGFELGTPRRMGPGFFPLMLGILAMLIGCAIMIVEALGGRRRNPADGTPAADETADARRIHWRPLVLVPLSIAAFAWLMENAGLVWAVCALVVIAGLAEPRPRPIMLALLALGTVVGVWLIFVAGLGLPFDMM
jgi:hypothetical protein